ncbi:MAG: hypothetical protein KatS3mg019_0232 [Fimbriimonadales bacterium]|nr:MAG: hypothetical protein KatS3mg019_0232 [Fimbriimonadales bacterium]
MDTEPRKLGEAQAPAGGAEAIPLTQLPKGAQARIVRVVHDHDGHWRKLSALGIMPGAIVSIQQRFPAYAVRIGLSTVALDAQLAGLLFVEPL